MGDSKVFALQIVRWVADEVFDDCTKSECAASCQIRVIGSLGFVHGWRWGAFVAGESLDRDGCVGAEALEHRQ